MKEKLKSSPCVHAWTSRLSLCAVRSVSAGGFRRSFANGILTMNLEADQSCSSSPNYDPHWFVALVYVVEMLGQVIAQCWLTRFSRKRLFYNYAMLRYRDAAFANNAQASWAYCAVHRSLTVLPCRRKSD